MFEHIDEKEAVIRAALIEENGFTFYSMMAERTDDENAQRVFKMLANDEKKHHKILENKYFPEAGLTDHIDEEEIEIEEHLKKLGTPSDIFARKIDINKLVEAMDTPVKALRLALDTEMHSLEFFKAMSDKATTDEAKKIYLELADEERSHVDHIKELLEQYSE